MRVIYADEAGTSPKEPVRVVASIIVHGDKELRHLTQEIQRVIQNNVPEPYLHEFHFHGKEIFSGAKWFKRED